MTLNNLRTDSKYNPNNVMENFEALKIPVLELVTTAERLLLVQNAGRKVYDTDLFTIFVSNGNAWVEVS